MKSLAQVKDIAKFIIPSLIGVILFMIPMKIKGEFTILIAFFADVLQTILAPAIPAIATGLVVFTAIVTLYTNVAKPKWVINSNFFSSLFLVTPFWIVTRFVGMLLILSTFFEVGPEWIWSGDTGGVLLYDLIAVLFTIFFLAGFFLPLLLNFGLLEFFGTLLNKLMRPLFTLPGRSSIDCLTSWIGDGTIGVLLTNKQYEDGYYTKREAAVIGTTFSIVSITFSIIILKKMELDAYIVPYYLTIVLAGFVAAIIMPRIPPLSRKPDTYYNYAPRKEDSYDPNLSQIQLGLARAIARTKQNQGIVSFMQSGMKNVLDMWLSVIPVVMAFGTIGLILAEHTVLFQILGKPFEPLLEWMQIPQAKEAAQTIVVGFADMLLPTIIASGTIEVEMTKFIVAALSVSQLIYLSEVGGLLLASKLPVTFLDLMIIFIQRTLISLPIITIVAHLLF